MSDLVIFIITASTFLTSMISGIFGMAGGMILKVVFLNVLTVNASMIIHALIQMVANGWRSLIWRKHIVWKVLPPYFWGIGIGITLVSFMHYVPSAAVVLIIMGIIPIFCIAFSRYIQLTIENKKQTLVAATVLTFIQMTTGVIGPLLDLLYNTSNLTRQEIVSTKAFSQTIMHFIRICYYSILIPMIIGAAGEGWPEGLTIWVAGLFIVASIAGTSAAAPMVQRMNDKKFKAYSKVIILIVSVYCLIQGLYLTIY
jgi:uncharacterized membrane protein YfcA